MGATIPLCAFADQPETLERDARQIDGFRRDIEPVHGCRVGDDHLDHSDIDPERHRARALLRPHLAVVDQLLPVEVPDLLFANGVLGKVEPTFAASRLCLEREDRRSFLLIPKRRRSRLSVVSVAALLRRGGLPGPGLPSYQQIERAGHVPDRLGRHLRIDRRGLQLCVAKQHLDHPDVGPALEQMGGKAVPQRVG